MFTISILRTIGIILALVFIFWTFSYFRGSRWKRFSFALSILLGISCLIISLYPSSLNFFYMIPTLADSPNGRIIGIIIFSIIFLFFLIVRSNIKNENMKINFDKLIRAISLSKINHYDINKLGFCDILLIIPAYNEAKNLSVLLPKILSENDEERVKILIIDDCSSDNTHEITQKYGVAYVKNIINRGQGGASRLGYDIAKNVGAKIVVTMDADNQHRIEDLPIMIKPIVDDEADLVIGSRKLGKEENKNTIRKIGVFCLSKLLSILIGAKITDVSSGYKAFSNYAIQKLELREDQYQASEIISMAIKNGIRIKEVPIKINERMYGKTKKGNNFRYGIGFTKALLKNWWR